MNNALAQAIADVAVGLARELPENVLMRLEVTVDEDVPQFLAVLRVCPEPGGLYELSKRLSRDVLYPVFKEHGVFCGLWCVEESDPDDA